MVCARRLGLLLSLFLLPGLSTAGEPTYKRQEVALGHGILWDFKAPFDFHEFDAKQKMCVKVSDEDKIRGIGRQISPINHISADDPPTIIFHGDKDWIVPIQQAQIFVDKLQKAGADAKLVVKAGADHGWADSAGEMTMLVDWFDKYLVGSTKPAE